MAEDLLDDYSDKGDEGLHEYAAPKVTTKVDKIISQSSRASIGKSSTQSKNN